MRNRPRSFVGAALVVSASLVSLAVFLLLTPESTLDWDTYGRLGFISVYDPSVGGDTHVLYHRIAWLLYKSGLSAVDAVFSLTAGSWFLFLLVVDGVARARGLTARQRLFAFVCAVGASPGMLAMVWMAEDNVAYVALCLGFFHLMMRPRVAVSKETRVGCMAGVLWGLALLVNITVLIYFALVPVGLLALGLGRRSEATRIACAVGVALIVYFGFHLIFGNGASVAMQEYVVKAVRLEDFGEDTAPTFSFMRLEQFVLGCRAMFLTPTVYRMDLPGGLLRVVNVYLPLILLALYGVVGAWFVARIRSQSANVWPVLPGALVGLSLAFPYFYEPLLIERWDLFWLCYFIVMLSVIRAEPRYGIEVLLAVAILIQVGCSVLVTLHHLGGVFITDHEAESAEIAREITEQPYRAVVLPEDIEATQMAHLRHHAAKTAVFLVSAGPEGITRCVYLEPWLRRREVSCRRLLPALQAGTAYVHSDANGAVDVILASASD